MGSAPCACWTKVLNGFSHLKGKPILPPHLAAHDCRTSRHLFFFFFLSSGNLGILLNTRTGWFLYEFHKEKKLSPTLLMLVIQCFYQAFLDNVPHVKAPITGWIKRTLHMLGWDTVTAKFLLLLKSHPECNNLLFCLLRRQMPEVSLGPPWNLFSALSRMQKPISNWILLSTCLLSISTFV